MAARNHRPPPAVDRRAEERQEAVYQSVYGETEWAFLLQLEHLNYLEWIVEQADMAGPHLSQAGTPSSEA